MNQHVFDPFHKICKRLNIRHHLADDTQWYTDTIVAFDPINRMDSLNNLHKVFVYLFLCLQNLPILNEQWQSLKLPKHEIFPNEY